MGSTDSEEAVSVGVGPASLTFYGRNLAPWIIGSVLLGTLWLVLYQQHAQMKAAQETAEDLIKASIYVQAAPEEQKQAMWRQMAVPNVIRQMQR